MLGGGGAGGGTCLFDLFFQLKRHEFPVGTFSTKI